MTRLMALLCLGWAGSVAAQEGGPPPPPPERPVECVPSCRSGFVCNAGQCVSRCNPPCEAGARCLENGECAAPIQPLSVTPVGQRVNRGWAVGAGVLAAVSAGVILVLTGAAVALNGNVSASYVGAATLVYAGIALPISAVGAGSGRWDPRITGAVGWRVLAWVSFGFAMTLGVVATAMGFADLTFPSYGIAALGGLGVISALSFMADAFITAGQGRELLTEPRASLLRLQPLFALSPGPRGGVTATVGWAVAF